MDPARLPIWRGAPSSARTAVVSDATTFLTTLLRERIRTNGPISFHEFMQMAFTIRYTVTMHRPGGDRAPRRFFYQHQRRVRFSERSSPANSRKSGNVSAIRGRSRSSSRALTAATSRATSSSK